MKFARSIAAVFTTAAMALAAGCVQTPEENQAALKTLQAADGALLQKAGFEILTVTGAGTCQYSHPGEVTAAYSVGPDTDVGYLLKKTSNDQLTYRVCMQHSVGTTTMRGLSAVEPAGGMKP